MGVDRKSPVTHMLQPMHSRISSVRPSSIFLGKKYEVGVGDSVQDRSDRAVDLGPDRFELACAFPVAVVIEIAGLQARELNKRTADALYDIAYRDLLGRTRQHVTTVCTPFAANDIDPLEHLHDLKEKFGGYVLVLGYVLDADR